MIGLCPRAVLYPAGPRSVTVQPLEQAPCLGAASTLWPAPRQTLLWLAVACATPSSAVLGPGHGSDSLRWGQHVRVFFALHIPLPKTHPLAAALRRGLSLAASPPFPPT